MIRRKIVCTCKRQFWKYYFNNFFNTFVPFIGVRRNEHCQQKIKKVILAYSGGLDTSVIVRWLIETYKCEVICFAADVGQKEELTGLKEKGN